MVRYRNKEDGRVLEYAAEDEWLEVSWEWERVQDELEPVKNDNKERTDD